MSVSDNKDFLALVSDISTESEIFSPVPKGYKKGRCRYVFFMGTVMSWLGKGIFSSCLAKLMQYKGIKSNLNRQKMLLVKHRI